MKTLWITPVLLSSALLVGCGDKSASKTEDSRETAPVVTAPGAGVAQGAPEAVSPNDDASLRPRADEPTIAPAPRPAARPPATPPRSSAARPAVPAERADRSADTPAPARPQYREVTARAGTALPLELLTPLSSATAVVETPVRARLRQAITVDGDTVIPAGSVLTGFVTDVADAGRVKGRARLAFRFTEAQVNGAREDLRTDLVTVEGVATKSEDATKIGAGAGIGAVIGGIVGGGEGAAKGAAIGGAAGTGAVLATKGRQVTLAEGADITATLADPFTARIRVR